MASHRDWKTAECSSGFHQTELILSPKYQRHEKPCQKLCERPLLKENKTASATGTSDQTRYSQVNPSRNHGCRQGLGRHGLSRPKPTLASAGAVAARCLAVAVVMTRPSPCGSSRSRSRSSE